MINHERIEKIRREIMVLKAINEKNENFPNLIDFGKDHSSGIYFIVYDFFGKFTMRELLKKQYLDEDIKKIIKKLIKSLI